MLVVVFLLPSVYSESAASPVTLLLLGEISTLHPIMLSSICIGQEGRSITNIYMLPISSSDLMAGKLVIPLVISAAACAATGAITQLVFPMAWDQFAVLAVALGFIVLIQGHIGMALGARYPDFSLGPRARYVTMLGFLLAFVFGGLATFAMFSPLVVYLVTPFFSGLGLPRSEVIALLMVITALIGVVLLFTSRSLCKASVRKFLSDMTR